eukprot:154008_1
MALVPYSDSDHDDDDNDVNMNKTNKQQPKIVNRKKKRSFDSYHNTEPHRILIDNHNNNGNDNQIPKQTEIKKRRKLKFGANAPKLNPFWLDPVNNDNNKNDTNYSNQSQPQSSFSFGDMNANYNSVPPPASLLNKNNNNDNIKPFKFTVNGSFNKEMFIRNDKPKQNTFKFAPRQIRNKTANINTEDVETFYSKQSFQTFSNSKFSSNGY